MRKKMFTFLALCAIAGLGLAVSGCGGGSKSSSGTTAAATTAAPATTEATTTAAATTAPATTTSGGTSIASAGNCRDFANLASQLGQAFSGAGGGDIQKTKDFLQKIAAAAPADIKGDFQVIADAYGKIADALKGVDLSGGKVPPPDVIARLQALSSQIDQAKLTAAEQHIAAWVQKNCHA